MRLVTSIAVILAVAAPATAAPPTSPEVPTADELASIMRTLIVNALPSPLVAKDFNWGHQKMVTNGITWKGDGILRKPVKQEKLKNDGTWRRVRVEAFDPEKAMTLVVKNVAQPAKGKVTFDMAIALPAHVKFEQQLWKDGTRLYSGETRARFRPILLLRCESVSRVEKSSSFIPDVIFRMRVTDAKLSYDDFKVEHTAGVGGELANVLGDALFDTLKLVRPDLEKDMLDKAGKAIIKAGDTKDVRLGLGKLLDGK
jgi:hypothetical protein